MKRFVAFILFFGGLVLYGCSKEDILLPSYEVEQANFAPIKKGLGNESLGVQNAIKKARQMTDIKYTPLNPIECYSTLLPNETYKGMIYSSVKEIGTYVGDNVSFHTFMTAINNPRSKIYTEKINEPPYHGTNCKAYYGTVCSGLVSYALGLNEPRLTSSEFATSDMMEEVNFFALENIHLADVLWRQGHVAMITDIVKDEEGNVEKIEISEANSPICRRYSVSSSTFLNSTMQIYTNVYRYKYIDNNYNYTPANEFVAVDDETLIPYQYNEDLCVDKGDKSCYLESEKVVINVYSENKPFKIEVFKDHELYYSYVADSIPDISFDSLPYGDYCARVVYLKDETTGITPVTMNSTTRANSITMHFSDYTYWKVVNTDIQIEKNNPRILFKSKNSKPIYLYACNIKGSRPPITEATFESINEVDIRRGYIDINNYTMREDYPLIKIVFSTEYGNIVSTPINWYE